MIISAADEKTFILSDEIIDHVYCFFQPVNRRDEKTHHACAALQALIVVIGTILSAIDCPESRELATKAIERSFTPMLNEVPAVRAELEGEQREFHQLSRTAM